MHHLWQIHVLMKTGGIDHEASRVREAAPWYAAHTAQPHHSARLFLIEGDLTPDQLQFISQHVLSDPLTEYVQIIPCPEVSEADPHQPLQRINVLFKPGVTDHVAESAHQILKDLNIPVSRVATGRVYWFPLDADPQHVEIVCRRVIANEAIERVIRGPLTLQTLELGHSYKFELVTVPLCGLDDQQLLHLSRQRQLSLSLEEMRALQEHYSQLQRDPTDIELETFAQTWSEHCSHKTLKGRIDYRDEQRSHLFTSMLKETIFAATQEIRRRLGPADWCVSVFEDNAGVVQFDDEYHLCFKVETHNHPSAIEPYGGANTGIGGVIRDPLGTGRGAQPICNTDVFCVAPPDWPAEKLPPGVLHPRGVLQGVVAGVRDYGNRMGIPTVNGGVFFHERYLGNPLVFCGTAALLPKSCATKNIQPGDWIVTVGGRTGRDGIHGATFSSLELTETSEQESGGAVQIGHPIMEKMLLDVLLVARDQGWFRAITDCGAGGFSSAVGEMAEQHGAEVWLDQAPLKYAGLSYTEIWISEAQERMVLAVPPEHWEALHRLCHSEGVEATIIGRFTSDRRLRLKYREQLVGDLDLEFLHHGRPDIVRRATFTPSSVPAFVKPSMPDFQRDLLKLLSSWNVCSRHWIIRQYDHEVQGGSVIKPLVGALAHGPSDAAIVRPRLNSRRGVVLACGMNPYYGELDPYWMALAAVDEAIRNCVAVGADPRRIALLDNFCWGNTQYPENLGSLVRAALGCRDAALAFGTPFISGKDSLNNEFVYHDAQGQRQSVSIPPSLLISAIGQITDVEHAVTMDLKRPENLIYIVGMTREELGGSHWGLIHGVRGGEVPRVDLAVAPQIMSAVHRAISQGWVASCHDLSEGGLAVAAAEMALAGMWGLEIDLQPLQLSSGLRDVGSILFSESCTRFLVEVAPEHSRDFERLFPTEWVTLIGEVVATPRLRVVGDEGFTAIDLPVQTLLDAWRQPLDW